jgi:hypothetical protein
LGVRSWEQLPLSSKERGLGGEVIARQGLFTFFKFFFQISHIRCQILLFLNSHTNNSDYGRFNDEIHGVKP